MKGLRTAPVLCALLALAPVRGFGADPIEIGIIDFYGLRSLSAEKVRQTLTFREGDTIVPGERPEYLSESARRLEKLRGVVRVRTEPVCCDHGKAIVYVGIVERGAPVPHFRETPEGPERLPDDILQTDEEFSRAVQAAVQSGNASEDHSAGHSLARDPAIRATQEAFITYAQRDVELLTAVLRNSADRKHRALAAQVIGYVQDKQAVVGDLVYGMTDPDGEVRNNSMRTLLVFAQATKTPERHAIRIPHAPFIDLLDSPVWTDRNKACAAVMALTSEPNEELLAALRREALVPLSEMARWKSEGHAFAAFAVLARIAGYPNDAAILRAWESGEREEVIRAATRSRARN